MGQIVHPSLRTMEAQDSVKEPDRTYGVLLLNLGGPDSLASVKPFLYNLFSDREIIRLGPSFLQKPIAWLISSLRAGKTLEAYSLIGGRSPILDMTMCQAWELEAALQEGVGHQKRFKVYVGMRYWHPFIEDTLKCIHNDGIKKIVAIGLYPQYSVATTGSSFRMLSQVLEHAYGKQTRGYSPDKQETSFVIQGEPFTVYGISSWHKHPLYLDALAQSIGNGLDAFGSNPSLPQARRDIHILFSAHSLPVKFIEEGDPYERQIMETVGEVARRFPNAWSLSYQSKSGPVKWLAPSTESMIEDLARRGVRNLLIVPVSFVSDHVETLFEIDILYRKMAESFGMRLQRAEALNTHPLFIAALKDLVLKAVKVGPWQE